MIKMESRSKNNSEAEQKKPTKKKINWTKVMALVLAILMLVSIFTSIMIQLI